MDNRHNTGNYNTGNYNTGDFNTGDFNTGYYNTGDFNTGNYNTGYYNTGDFNTGNFNTGYYNTGNCNTGDFNAGNCNTGNYNSGYGPTSFFCAFSTDDRPVYFFNKIYSGDIPSIPIQPKLTEWVDESQMTEEEKRQNPQHKTTKGFLRQKTYQKAWQEAWRDASPEDRDAILSLPNFDPAIFREITGIDVTIQPREMVIDGITYILIPKPNQ